MSKTLTTLILTIIFFLLLPWTGIRTIKSYDTPQDFTESTLVRFYGTEFVLNNFQVNKSIPNTVDRGTLVGNPATLTFPVSSTAILLTISFLLALVISNIKNIIQIIQAIEKKQEGPLIFKIIFVLLILHGVQNSLGFIFSNGNLVAYIWEFLGGLFSIVCGFLLLRRTRMSVLVVLLRAAGGIFNFSTFSMLTSPIRFYQPEIITLLRLWPIILFIFLLIYCAYILIKNKNTIRITESRAAKIFYIVFTIIMFINWVSVFFFLFSLRDMCKSGC